MSAMDKTGINTAGLFLLGIAEAAIVLIFGYLSGGPAGTLGITMAVIPIFALTIYTATAPVMKGRHRSLYAVLTVIAAVVVTVTMVLGTTLFVESLPWWVAGAVLSAVPFLVVGWIETAEMRPDRVTGDTVM